MGGKQSIKISNIHQVTNTADSLLECQTEPMRSFKDLLILEGNSILNGSEHNVFDIQFALNQFSGNQSLLLKILVKFDVQYQNFEDLFIQNLEQGELVSVKQQVHELKGVSGNLGMQNLHLACKEFEQKMAPQVSEDTSESFLQAFRQTLTLVQRYLSENNIVRAPEPNTEQTDNKSALIKALKRNEFISESKMQTYLKSIDMSTAKLNQLEQAISNLDYPRAIQMLE